MKKSNERALCVPLLKKTKRIMKLTTLFSIGVACCISASTYAQGYKLSMNKQNSSIIEILKDIENNSEFTFFFNDNKVNVNKKASINVKDATLDEVLAQVLKNTGYDYQIIDRQVLIKTASSSVSSVPSVQQNQKAITGIIIGLGSRLCLYIFNFSGNMLDMEIGFSMVQEMDPTTNVNSTITSNFYMYIFMLLFLVSDMHYFIIDAMMDSYQLVPIGGAKFSVDLYHIMVTFITNYFVIGFRIVLPIFCCMLVINIVLGILAKIAPQMNMFVVGMQLKVFVGLVLLFLTMQLFAGAADFLFDEMHTFTKYFVQAMAA